MDALKYAQPGDTLEILRVNRKNELTMAHPCPHCLAAIWEAGIKQVRYTDWNGQWQTINMKHLDKNDIVDNFRINALARGTPVVGTTSVPKYLN